MEGRRKAGERERGKEGKKKRFKGMGKREEMETLYLELCL